MVAPAVPGFGRPSPASSQPAVLRAAASAADAAYRADGGDDPWWCLRAASVAGVRHRLAGGGPEDAYAWCLLGPGPVDAGADAPGTTVVVAVADGVGSVAGSAGASTLAVAAACAAAAAGDGSPPGPAEAGRIFAAAAAAVADHGGATTLVVAVVGPAGTGWAARVGDSAAYRLVDADWWPLWAGGDADGPVPVATDALPAWRTPDVVDVTLGVGDTLVLVTDGVAGPLADGPTTVAPALAAGLDAPPSPLALAGLVDFSRQGCFDDRTLVALWRRDPP